MNEFLFLISILINFTALTLLFKHFGKTGLFAFIAFATVFANIIVVKCVDLFTLSITLGNVTFGAVSLATDMLNENYGEKEAKKSVKIGFSLLVLFTIMSQITLLFVPNTADFAHDALYTLFSLSPRICIGSFIAYFISTNLNINIFSKIREKLPQNNKLWVRNNLSTIISQLIDTIIFTTIAFAFVFPLHDLIAIMFTTWLVKIIIAIIDTPFLYLSKKIFKKRELK